MEETSNPSDLDWEVCNEGIGVEESVRGNNLISLMLNGWNEKQIKIS